MSEIMKRMVIGVAVMAVAMLLSQGCSTPIGGAGPRPKGEITARMAQSRLHVGVEAETEDGDSDITTGRVQDMVEDALVDSGYRVDRNQSQVLVDMDVETELWDQTGPYYLYKGACSASANRTYDDKLLGKRRFSARGKRVQDKEDAIVSLAEKLGAKTSDWVVKTSAPGKVGVTAADLVIEHSWFNFFKKRPEYVNKFIKYVEQVDGVISCRLAKEDHETKRRVFRIVYVEDKIPEGLLNRIASIEELDIKPAN